MSDLRSSEREVALDRLERLRDAFDFDEIRDAFLDESDRLAAKIRFENHQAVVDELLIVLGIIELALRTGWLTAWPHEDPSWEFFTETVRRRDFTNRLVQGVGGEFSQAAALRISGGTPISSRGSASDFFDAFLAVQSALATDPDALEALAALRDSTRTAALRPLVRGRRKFLSEWFGRSEDSRTLEALVHLIGVLAQLEKFCQTSKGDLRAASCGFADCYVSGWGLVHKAELAELSQLVYAISTWDEEDVVTESRLTGLSRTAMGRVRDFLDKTIRGSLATAE